MGLNNIITIVFYRNGGTEINHHTGSARCITTNHMYYGESIQPGPSSIADLAKFAKEFDWDVWTYDNLEYLSPQIIIAV